MHRVPLLNSANLLGSGVRENLVFNPSLCSYDASMVRPIGYVILLNVALLVFCSTPVSAESSRVDVLFWVNSVGDMSRVRLARSCGSSNRDQHCIESIELSAPFPPLPEGSPPEKCFRASFEYACMGPAICAIFHSEEPEPDWNDLIHRATRQDRWFPKER
jgi:hypothetical protein